MRDCCIANLGGLHYLHDILSLLLEFLVKFLPHEDLAPAQSIQLLGVSGGMATAAIGHGGLVIKDDPRDLLGRGTTGNEALQQAPIPSR